MNELSEPENVPSLVEPPRAATSERRSRLWPWAIAISVVLLVLRYGMPFLAGDRATTPWFDWIATALVGLIATAAPIVAIRASGERVFDGVERPRWLAEFSAAIIVLLPLLLSIGLFSLLFQKQLDSQPDEQAEQIETLSYLGGTWAWAMFAAAACVWAPIFEEITFRRLLFRGFSTRIGGFLAAFASSTVFALMHSYGELRTIAIFIVGMALTGIYAWRKTLLAPMFLHAMFNSVFVLALFGQMALNEAMPYLGIAGERHDDGHYVVDVEPGSPANQAGVQAGDLLIELDGAEVKSFLDVKRVLVSHHVGDRINAVVLRDGEEVPLQMSLDWTGADAMQHERADD